MGPAYFVIAIMGCGDGGFACQTVAAPAMHYGSEQACLAARADVLMANSDLDFPMLVAECVPISRKMKASKPVPVPKDALTA